MQQKQKVRNVKKVTKTSKRRGILWRNWELGGEERRRETTRLDLLFKLTFKPCIDQREYPTDNIWKPQITDSHRWWSPRVRVSVKLTSFHLIWGVRKKKRVWIISSESPVLDTLLIFTQRPKCLIPLFLVEIFFYAQSKNFISCKVPICKISRLKFSYFFLYMKDCKAFLTHKIFLLALEKKSTN